MNKINILDRSVSELIAAGEVIERPASVVKELIENSIDAGATKIKIEIKNGGVTYIKITDNGIGIRRQDVKKAFLRHATSKVSNASDLDNILTLGFRGEALASISAVSKIEIITRTKDALDATRYVINANQEKSQERELEDIGAPVGTTIIIRDLFFNVPARMKFLKKDITEGNAIATIIERLALSHPEISFVFIREGQEKLSTCGDNNLLSTIYCVFGSQVASSMLPLKYIENNININGYISSPSESRASRSMQTFFVNSRYVKSKTCCAALEEAYKSFITLNKFPACVLNIELSSNVIDINVHPAKLEIRFANEKKIHDIVYAAVKNCLLSHLSAPVMNLKNYSNKNLNNNFENKLNNLINNSLSNFSEYKSSENTKSCVISSSSVSLEDNNFNKTKSDKDTINNNFINPKDFETLIKKINKSSEKIEIKLNQDNLAKESLDDNLKSDLKKQDCNNFDNREIFETKQDNINRSTDLDNIRQEVFEIKNQDKFIGEVFNSYVVLEKNNELILIDKHAAHERIIYEKIKDGRFKNYRQVLIKPEILEISLLEYQVAIDNINIFKNMGFLLEDFGEKTIIIREVPLILSNQNITDIINEIIMNIMSNKNNIIPSVLDKIYYTFACKAAIKAGDKNDDLELKELVKILEKNSDLKNCPHGRPIFISIKKKDIEKQFLR